MNYGNDGWETLQELKDRLGSNSNSDTQGYIEDNQTSERYRESED